MAGANNDHILMIRNKQGQFQFHREPKDADKAATTYRSHGQAQREGSRLLSVGETDAFTIFKAVSEHH